MWPCKVQNDQILFQPPSSNLSDKLSVLMILTSVGTRSSAEYVRPGLYVIQWQDVASEVGEVVSVPHQSEWTRLFCPTVNNSLWLIYST